eukprot:2728204-Pleurochrysis_carterae.AAC.1
MTPYSSAASLEVVRCAFFSSRSLCPSLLLPPSLSLPSVDRGAPWPRARGRALRPSRDRPR